MREKPSLPKKKVRRSPSIDISLPGDRPPPSGKGALHRYTQSRPRGSRIFRRKGVALRTARTLRRQWACFAALNSRQTSGAATSRTNFICRMEVASTILRLSKSGRWKFAPRRSRNRPGRRIARDEVDANHSAQFHQIEGLYVDENFRNMRSQFRPKTSRACF